MLPKAQMVFDEDISVALVKVAAIGKQRPYKNHTSQPLYKTNDIEPCPVQFAYIYLDDSNDHQRWILAFVRVQKRVCTIMMFMHHRNC